MSETRKKTVVFFDGGTPPSIPEGRERDFIVTVKRRQTDRVNTFCATYINAYPLEYEERLHAQDAVEAKSFAGPAVALLTALLRTLQDKDNG